MNPSEFDDILSQARQFGRLLAAAFEGLSGEDLDLESAVRRYPLVAVGLALGAGVLGGWWVGRKLHPRIPPPQPKSQLDIAKESLRKVLRREDQGMGQPPPRLLPEGLDRVRDLFPELTAEEAGALARDWLDSVVEPKLRQGLESVVSNVSEGKLGAFLRQQMQRLEGNNGTEPH